jgi:predicted permease
MPILSRITNYLRNILAREKTDHDLDDEVRSYSDLLAQEKMREGISPQEARRKAILELGGIEQVKEQVREARAGAWLDSLLQDLRYATRMLRKNPGFTAITVLTLALGIGASTAVFSLVNTILLKPLPYSDAEKIVMPVRLAPPTLNLGYEEINWGLPESQLLIHQSKAFQSVGVLKNDSFNLTAAGEPALLDGVRVSAGFFPTMGAAPVLGRAFTTDEDQPGHEHETVLSYRLWLDRFGGDPNILGRSVQLNSSAYTVVGVMPPGFVFPRGEDMPAAFNFPRESQLWVPLALPATKIHREDPDELSVIARLKSGVSLAQAQAEMNVFAKTQEQQNPGGQGWFNSRVTPLARVVAGDTRRPLILILCAVCVVLLIACANIASLLLTRSLARRKEFSLRAALGAGSRRIIRQLLTESLLLAATAGLLGILVAEAGIYLVKVFGPANIPRLAEVSLDLRVLAFAIGITLATGILFGLAPAMGASRCDLVESLKEGGLRSSGSSAGQRLRKTLLVSEVALALVLVVAAGLLLQTFFHLLSVDPGFNPSRVLTFELSLPDSKYQDTAHIVALYRTILDRLQSVPGVQSVGIVKTVPMGGATDGSGIRFTEDPPRDNRQLAYSNFVVGSPGFFSAVGTPVLRGRDFLETDVLESAPVAIVNSAMAKKFWPGQDPVGQHVGLGSKRYPLMTVVGVVADIKHLSFREEPGPEIYVPFTQKSYPSLLTMQVVLRTKSDPAAMTASARDAIHSVDPDLPLAAVTTLDALVNTSMAQPRFSVLLLGAFAALALLLASIGLYGVISYSVAQRTQEIGIRMALGAQRGAVFAMVLREGIGLALFGIVIGVAVALAVTQALAAFLYGVRPADPLTFVTVSIVLLCVALAASYIPARRATRVDPMVALRHD